jgi:integrase
VLGEAEVDQPISGVGKKTAAFLQLLKDTGIRSGEVWNIELAIIDHERSTVCVWSLRRTATQDNSDLQ